MKTLFRWIADYFRTVGRCLTDLGFYREARGRRLGETVGHLAVAISIFWLVPLLVAFFVGLNFGWRALDGYARANFASDARFEISGGTFTSNLEKPVVTRFADGGVIVINTATSTVELGAGEWGLVFGSTGVLQRSASGTPDQFNAWPKEAKASFTRDQVLDGIRRALPWLTPVVAVIFLIVMTLVSALSVALMVVFYAFMLWLLMKLLKRPIRYYEAAVLAGYAATLPILARLVFSGKASFISTLLYWILLGLIARDLYRKGEKDLGNKPEEPVVP